MEITFNPIVESFCEWQFADEGDNDKISLSRCSYTEFFKHPLLRDI